MPGLVLSQHRPTIQPKLPTHTRSQSIDSTPTNTLILTSLPLGFFHPSVLDPLRAHFSKYGDLHTWAPLKGFGRVIAVFWNVEDAERLRNECDGLHVGGPNSSLQTLKLYRGEMTSLEAPSEESRHLQVPVQTKNFLISPPGSPPVGWEQIEEEAPNTASLAADLVAALNRLQAEQEGSGERSPDSPESSRSDGKRILLDTERDSDLHPLKRGHARTQSGSLLVLLEDCDASDDGAKTPDEVVEYLDPRHELSSSRGGSPPRRVGSSLPQTRAPPGFGSITSVRATAESMRTPMPPMQRA